MDTTDNTWAWVAGLVVVVLIVAALWYFFVPARGTTQAPNEQAVASSSAQGSTGTTQGGSPASETRSGSTVAAVINSLGDSSQAQALFSSTGVLAGLTGKGPYTVFVPINEAFSALPPGTLSAMTAAQKKRLAQYHVVSGKQLDADALHNGSYTALSKDTLNFSVRSDNGSAYVNSALVIKEYRASNGIVYVIGSVLVPPQLANPQTGH